MNTFLLLLGVILLLLILGQILIWLNQYIIGPAWQRSLPKRKLFLDLVEAGFVVAKPGAWRHLGDGKETLVGIIGEIDGYAVEISSNYRTRFSRFRFYLIRVFFDVNGCSSDKRPSNCQEILRQSNLFRWDNDIKFSGNQVNKKIYSFNTNGITSRQILHVTNDLIAELKRLQLSPVSYSEGMAEWQKLHN